MNFLQESDKKYKNAVDKFENYKKDIEAKKEKQRIAVKNIYNLIEKSSCIRSKINSDSELKEQVIELLIKYEFDVQVINKDKSDSDNSGSSILSKLCWGSVIFAAVAVVGSIIYFILKKMSQKLKINLFKNKF